MSLNYALIAELKQEATGTRRLLERIPDDKLGWKPHEKSFTMGRLATHVAELAGWITMTMNTEELDFAKWDYKPVVAANNAELLDILDDNTNKAIAALEAAGDADFMANWTLRRADHIMFTMPKVAVIRSFALSHLYHHRGQLSVYMRLNDIPVPGLYGPSADDKIPMEDAVGAN